MQVALPLSVPQPQPRSRTIRSKALMAEPDCGHVVSIVGVVVCK